MPMFMFPLFPPDVDSLDREEVVECRRILEGMAGAYGGELTSFAIHRGTVLFGVSNDEMAKFILESFEQMTGKKPEVVADAGEFTQRARKILGEP